MKYTELTEDLRNYIEREIERIVENTDFNWVKYCSGNSYVQQVLSDEEIEFEDGFIYATIDIDGKGTYDKGDYYTPPSSSADVNYNVTKIIIDWCEGNDVIKSEKIELDEEIYGNISW